MTLIEAAAAGLIGGIIGGLVAGWREWRDLIVDYHRHGLDNHLCDRACCAASSPSPEPPRE